MQDPLTFGLTFLLNSAVAWVIIRGIYYPLKRDKGYVLTFFTFNTLIFLISALLSGVDLSVGFGFSLFAIFSILRYRTDPIPIREMTYLFVMMALPVVNAVMVSQSNYAGLAIANAAIILALFIAEKEWGFHYTSQRTVKYERIELVKPENYPLLLADLRERTGLDITHCEIGKLDFLQDVAEIKITYNEPKLYYKELQEDAMLQPSESGNPAARTGTWQDVLKYQDAIKY